MGGHKCAIFGCNRHSNKVFGFPNPKFGLDRFQKWVQAARNPNFVNLTTDQILKRGFVCPRHFLEDDFIHGGSRQRLRKTAVPVLNLPPDTSDNAALELQDFAKYTQNAQMMSDCSAIDMSTDDLDPQLVDTEFLQDLTLFDTKLTNIDDLKVSVDMPFFLQNINPNNNLPETGHSENQIETISDVNQQDIITSDENRDLDEVEVDEEFQVQINTGPVDRDNQENLNETHLPNEKPYFKSVKCYISDCNKFTEVCRICFRPLTKEEEVIKLYGEISREDETQIKNMLKLVLPDMDLEMYPNTTICTKCSELLGYSFHLKEMWLSTEAKLQKILEKKRAVINRDADLVIVKKEEKNKVLSEIDHNYADINETQHEEQKMTDSILKRLLSSNESSKKVKIYHGELNMSKPIATKSIRSQTTIKKKIWGLGPYMCEQCGRIFLRSKNLRSHLETHIRRKKVVTPKEPTFMCEICGNLFATYNSLRSHCQVHTEPKCSICGKEFERLKTLKSHIYRKHSCESFQCHLCGKQFAYARSLSIHLQKHNEQRTMYSCSICDKKFDFPSELRKHLPKHVTGRSWNCTYCGKCLKYERSLQKHIKIYHMNQGKFVCNFCNKPYWKDIDLQKHKIRIHGWFPEVEQVQQNAGLEIGTVEYEI